MSQSFFDNQHDEKPDEDIPHLDEEMSEGTRFQSDEGRLAAVMAYIPFLCFIPLLSMKYNKEARFHARQGVVLFLIELIALLFLVETVSQFVFTAVLLAAVAFSIAGIYFALQGRSFQLPIVGEIAERFKL